MSTVRGWHSRGYLPHIDAGEVPQFITWRLRDSIPTALIDRWVDELRHLLRADSNRVLESRIEDYIDKGISGTRILQNPDAAKIVQDALIFYHEQSYQLHSWVIMPTHVHVLLTPRASRDLRMILRPLKSYTAREIHRHLGGAGQLWQHDYFDRMPRSEAHFEKIVKYIEWNPRKAGLCTDPTHWPYSSANDVAMRRVLEKSAKAGRMQQESGDS